jgi:hypothetical protein
MEDKGHRTHLCHMPPSHYTCSLSRTGEEDRTSSKSALHSKRGIRALRSLLGGVGLGWWGRGRGVEASRRPFFFLSPVSRFRFRFPRFFGARHSTFTENQTKQMDFIPYFPFHHIENENIPHLPPFLPTSLVLVVYLFTLMANYFRLPLVIGRKYNPWLFRMFIIFLLTMCMYWCAL